MIYLCRRIRNSNVKLKIPPTVHRLTKFKGIPKDLFELYLKETEFRFNHRGQNLYHILNGALTRRHQ